MIIVTSEELNKMAFDKGYLPYEFFIEVEPAEIVELFLNGKIIYRTEHGYFAEM